MLRGVGSLLFNFPPLASGGAPVFTLGVTTTGAETLTLQNVTVAAGQSIVVDWGDGTQNIYAAGAGTRTHNYAGAGAWTVTISNPAVITALDLRDTKITLNATLARLASLTSLRIENISGFDSAHISAMALTFLYLALSAAGTVATTARADWAGIVVRKAPSPTIQMQLTQAQVDAVLLGIYDAFPNRTATAGTLNVAGTNAAPSGVLQAACPPTTGKEAAYELVNDTCGVSANHYAVVTITT